MSVTTLPARSTGRAPRRDPRRYDALDRKTALAIARDLDEPRVLFGVDVKRKVTTKDKETGELSSRYVNADVWHCSLLFRPEDGQLSGEKWGRDRSVVR